MKVAGRYVQTDGSTVFKWSDGSSLDPYAIVAGDQARVEGWSQPEGYVLAAKVVVTRR
jgi:acetyltransferase-like isoleucine patch superfamily enzyme